MQAISIHALLAESDATIQTMSWCVRYFYPRSPCGERPPRVQLDFLIFLISIHALLAESDDHMAENWARFIISIHALLAESDYRGYFKVHSPPKFLSTLSLRRATRRPIPSRPGQGNFYPRSPCGERLAVHPAAVLAAGISIHALLAESDPCSHFCALLIALFLSTLSLRRATAIDCCMYCMVQFLSTLSLRRATAHQTSGAQLVHPISIHALLAESDVYWYSYATTPEISIHALLAESDPARLPRQRPDFYFYPRSPCGERRCSLQYKSAQPQFLSTLSLRRATLYIRQLYSPPVFLSTLSLRRATRTPAGGRPTVKQFLSTLSLRRATSRVSSDQNPLRISIHALLAESDRAAMPVSVPPFRFLSTLSLRRATNNVLPAYAACGISIHALLAESDKCTP